MSSLSYNVNLSHWHSEPKKLTLGRLRTTFFRGRKRWPWGGVALTIRLQMVNLSETWDQVRRLALRDSNPGQRQEIHKAHRSLPPECQNACGQLTYQPKIFVRTTWKAICWWNFPCMKTANTLNWSGQLHLEGRSFHLALTSFTIATKPQLRPTDVKDMKTPYPLCKFTILVLLPFLKATTTSYYRRIFFKLNLNLAHIKSE